MFKSLRRNSVGDVKLCNTDDLGGLILQSGVI